MTQLTYEQVSQLLRYEHETGKLFWLARPGKGGLATEKEAGTLRKEGYRSVMIAYKSYQEHRIGWLLHNKEWPSMDIDHINGIKDDNRILNLRVVTISENQQNLRRANSNNKAGLLGVALYKGQYLATIKVNGRQHRLGKFKRAEDAHDAYLSAKRSLHPASTI